MHPYFATGAICAILIVAGSALSLVGEPVEPPAEMERAHATAGHGGQHKSGAYAWTGGQGKVPTSPAAVDRLASITIGSDKEFSPANGVRSGSGSFEDPFVISGWNVDTLYVHDTTKAFEIKDSYIGYLVLDWTGQGGYVHHNTIKNMRTNRNVERTGDPSATVIEKNQIDKVEELRHFDGVVANNTIGRESMLPLLDLTDDVVLNIAGLNGAGIHDNKIFGGVDMKIHGHHHSDATGAHSHNHGQPDGAQVEDHVEDHQTRYVDFLFYKNVIKDNGFGLRYNDLNHAGDDRTATSEQEPDLEKIHVHFTRVALVDNVIEGATLRIAILNSEDERHAAGQSAELVLQGNRIIDPARGDGLIVQDVADAHVYVRDNKVERGDSLLALGGDTGILLQRFRNSTIHVDGNALGGYKYGIRASQFDERTTWRVGQNSAPGSEYAVYWDNTVPNAPEGAEGAHEEGHGHSHGDDAASPSVLRRLAQT